MGSKKNKKVKQEETQEPAEIEIVEKTPKSHKRKRKLEEEVAEIKQEETVETPVKPKKKKKKNKDAEIPITTEVVEEEHIVTNGIVKSEPVKQEVVEINIIEDIKIDHLEPPQEDDQALHKEEVTMPQNDLMELLRRIEILIPENDNLSYKCRADKLQWSDIAFSTYSANECKETWNNVQKRIRRFRILKEVLEDAKSFVQNPPKNKKRHPEMPPKPPTGYQLFYRKKKPGLLLEKPGLDIAEMSKQISQMYKNLSPEKKMKYEKQAAQLKAKYEEELQVFYDNHPEIAECMRKEKMGENKPAKPSTPFLLYFKHQVRKNGNANTSDVNSDNAFKEQCKTQWKQLSMKKKIMWITKAEADVARYEEEMKEYISKHPNYNHIPMKSILNKEEITLKERYSGKPDKPPTSAYSLFSKNLLQSDEIKKITAKDRMNHISSLWKNCTEEEKNNYKAKVDELMEQYKKDYEKYLESLPEDKKALELLKNAPKKKAKPDNADKKKRGKGKLEKVPEPETPPISAFSYFVTNKNIEDRKVAKKEWKKLTEAERNEYEKKLVEIKREYILQFEKFLNSLSKEELEEYSKTKQELKFNSEDFVDEDDSSSSSSDTEEDSDDE